MTQKGCRPRDGEASLRVGHDPGGVVGTRTFNSRLATGGGTTACCTWVSRFRPRRASWNARVPGVRLTRFAGAGALWTGHVVRGDPRGWLVPCGRDVRRGTRAATRRARRSIGRARPTWVAASSMGTCFVDRAKQGARVEGSPRWGRGRWHRGACKRARASANEDVTARTGRSRTENADAEKRLDGGCPVGGGGAVPRRARAHTNRRLTPVAEPRGSRGASRPGRIRAVPRGLGGRRVAQLRSRSRARRDGRGSGR